MTADEDLAGLPPQTVLRGWKEIAAYIQVSEFRAQERAKWPRDPLPVMHDHRGPFAYVSGLRDWVARTRMAYKAHLQLNRARREEAEPVPVVQLRQENVSTEKRRASR